MMARGKPVTLWALLVGVLVLSEVAWPASAEGDERVVTIHVLDPQGNPVVGARVAARPPGQGQDGRLTDVSGMVSLEAAAGEEIANARVTAEGFAGQDVPIARGARTVEVRLRLARSERIEVQADRQPFMTVLTREQIARLPDDPVELAEMLQRMAGPGAIIRVNGYRSDRLPPKSQIREIRMRLNPFSADSHEAGRVVFEVITNPGGSKWHVAGRGALSESETNARQPLAGGTAAPSFHREAVELEGPLWPGHTGIALAVSRRSDTTVQPIRAALPAGLKTDEIRQPAKQTSFLLALEHALGKSQTLRFEWQRSETERMNLGVGGLDLAERAFGSKLAENVLRLSATGSMGGNAVRETRIQLRSSSARMDAASESHAVEVLGAFRAGGAQVSGGLSSLDLELAQDFDFVRGAHSFRGGLLLETGRRSSDEATNATGTYLFPGLEAFVQRAPITFSQWMGDPRVRVSYLQGGAYLQDEWRLSDRVSLGLGLRQELQRHLPDKMNVSPRLNLGWSPNSRTSVRLGMGVYREWFDPEALVWAVRQDGTRGAEVFVQNPAFPITAGAELPAHASQRVVREVGMRMPTVYQGSLSVERLVLSNLRLTSMAWAAKGNTRLRSRNLNLPDASGLRPDPRWGNVVQLETQGRASEYGLQASLNYWHGEGFGAFANYVWSKTSNDSDSYQSLPSGRGESHAEFGPALNDARHRISFNADANLPAGLSFAGYYYASSGLPYTLTMGADLNGDGLLNDRPPGLPRNSARGIWHQQLDVRLSWTRRWGKQNSGGGVTVVKGDAFESTTRSYGSGAKQLRLYLQATNVLNHVNPISYVGAVGSPLLGTATSSLPARRMAAGCVLEF